MNKSYCIPSKNSVRTAPASGKSIRTNRAFILVNCSNVIEFNIWYNYIYSR